MPKIEHGVIDLTNWDFDKDGIVKLDGEWAFYWKSFLYDTISNQVIPPDSGFVFVPGLWNEKVINGKINTAKGYASYRLLINTNTKQELAIKYINSATSCEIFVDGCSLFSSGTPGKTETTTKPGYKPAVVSFFPKGEKVEIVLQIANFAHKKGGQWETLFFGEKEQIARLNNQNIFIEIILIGCILIMAIFHLVIYFKNTYEKPLLYFGVFALLIAIKFLLSGEHTVYLLGAPKWINLVRIDYLSFYLSILSFLLFVRSLFPNEVHRFATKLFIVAAILSSVSVWVLPLFYFSYIMFYYQLLTIIGGVYAFFILYLAIKRKREGAYYFLFGFILLFACMVHDILNENEMIHSISIVPIGITLFILVKALMLSSQIRNALSLNIKLSAVLKVQNDDYFVLNRKYKTQNEQLIIAKEKAEESDRFKSAFLANVSHEIRSPMNGILGFSQLLRNTNLTEEKKKYYLDILNERGHHLLGVINDIIDVSKIETGQIDVHNDTLNLNDLFDQLYDSYFHVAVKKNLQFIRRNRLSGDEAIIWVDKQKLRQIFDNLIGNALKFTHQGEIEYGCFYKADIIEFYVRDTGIGIAPNEIEIIFNRFNQANKSISNQYGGTGLGLSIVKAYVEKMGGRIWVVSKEGQGSDFRFDLPYFSNMVKNKHTVNVSSVDLSKSQLTILVVEDDLTNAFLLEEILKTIDAKIIHAANGAQAFSIFLNQKEIDIVLLDIKLPDISGYELASRMKATHKHIPIVAQTAFALQGDKAKAIAAGCVDHIAKPIDSAELIYKIKRYTKGLN